MLGKKHSAETRERIRRTVIATHSTPEVIEKLRRAKLGKKHSAETIEKIRLGNRRKVLRTETKERISLAHKGVPLTGKRAKSPDHMLATSGILRSPENVTYRYTNLAHFVRTNCQLFAPEDVAWNGSRCRAYNGLREITGPNARIGSWKGWTVVSATECNLNDGVDLLGREFRLPNA